VMSIETDRKVLVGRLLMTDDECVAAPGEAAARLVRFFTHR